MATPLTVCVVVLGRHMPGLASIGTLMADTPALAPEFSYYQRLLARDPGEAADLIDRHIKAEPWGSVYDVLAIRADRAVTAAGASRAACACCAMRPTARPTNSRW